jgi:HAD superfamily hydrolase (TIGR01450 family)
MSRVAVIGVGAMGSRFARRFLESGHEVVVWNRTPGKATPLIAAGATMAETPAAAAEAADVVITMVADPPALRAVTEGPAGVAAGVGGETTVIEMSTVGPAAVDRLASALPAGTGLLDAPVLGSLAEAESGSLTIFVGGEGALVERFTPLLSVLGSPSHVGPRGAGAAAKLVANATLFGVLALLGEALALAEGLGLSRDAGFGVLVRTPLAVQAERRRRAVETGDYPRRFSLALACKDADLIAEAAAGAGVELRVAAAAAQWLADTLTAGWGDLDYAAVLARILRSQAPGPPSVIAASGAGAPQAGEQAPDLDFDGLIVDLDGVVWVGATAVPGSVSAIARLRARGVRLLFVTNDPRGSRAEYATRLRALGVPVDEGEIVTSGSALAAFLGEREGVGTTAFVIGSPSLKGELAQAGLELLAGDAGREAEIVAVGGHDGFDYTELRIATQAVRCGARLYAAGRDATFPMPDGPWPGTGSVVAAVEVAAGKTAIAVGKPEPFIFDVARSLLAGCRRVAIVGDNLAADVAGGKRAGLTTILVLTGASGRDDVATAEVTPDVVLPDLAALV